LNNLNLRSEFTGSYEIYKIKIINNNRIKYPCTMYASSTIACNMAYFPRFSYFTVILLAQKSRENKEIWKIFAQNLVKTTA